MDPDRWRRLNDIFQETLARAVDARLPFLIEACEGDRGLREDVERLVRAHERATGFLARPALAQAPDLLSLVDLSTPVADQHGADAARDRVSRNGALHRSSSAWCGWDGCRVRGTRRRA